MPPKSPQNPSDLEQGVRFLVRLVILLAVLMLLPITTGEVQFEIMPPSGPAPVRESVDAGLIAIGSWDQ